MQIGEVTVIALLILITIVVLVFIAKLERTIWLKNKAKRNEELFLAGRALARAKGNAYELNYLNTYNKCICEGMSKSVAIKKAIQ